MGTCFIIFKYFKEWIYFLLFHQHKPDPKGVRDEVLENPTALASGKLSTLS